MNVLTPFGRKLLDNAICIGSNSDDLFCDPRYRLDNVIRFSKINFSQESTLNTIHSFEGNASSIIFGDKNLDESVVGYEFEARDGSPIHTSDGIYFLKIAFDKKNITEVMFYGDLDQNGVSVLRSI